MKTRLLIVDDEAEIRDLLRDHFEAKGFEVDTAADGLMALESLASERTDIVISDIMMPQMDGTELLERIRHEYPMIHVIMITGMVTLENALACMRRGADTCIFKPFEDLAEIDAAVERAREELQSWINILGKLAAMKSEGRRV